MALAIDRLRPGGHPVPAVRGVLSCPLLRLCALRVHSAAGVQPSRLVMVRAFTACTRTQVQRLVDVHGPLDPVLDSVVWEGVGNRGEGPAEDEGGGGGCGPRFGGGVSKLGRSISVMSGGPVALHAPARHPQRQGL